MVTGKCFLLLALATVSLARTPLDMVEFENQLAELQRQVEENQKLREEILSKLLYLEDEMEVKEGEGKLCFFYFIFKWELLIKNAV